LFQDNAANVKSHIEYGRCLKTLTKVKVNGKAIPLHAWTGLEASRRFRLPDFKTSAHEVGKVVSPTHRPPLPPRKYS